MKERLDERDMIHSHWGFDELHTRSLRSCGTRCWCVGQTNGHTAWCRVVEAVAMATKVGKCALGLIFGCPSDASHDGCVGPNSRGAMSNRAFSTTHSMRRWKCLLIDKRIVQVGAVLCILPVYTPPFFLSLHPTPLITAGRPQSLQSFMF